MLISSSAGMKKPAEGGLEAYRWNCRTDQLSVGSHLARVVDDVSSFPPPCLIFRKAPRGDPMSGPWAAVMAVSAVMAVRSQFQNR